MSDGRNSSSSLAIPDVKAVVEELWWMLGLLEGLLDQGWATLTDQLAAKGLFLLIVVPSAAAHPKGALSVEGRGRSEEAMDTGRGLLRSRSVNKLGSSEPPPNIPKARERLLLLVGFRAGAGPLPSVASLTVWLRLNIFGTFQLDDRLVRRRLLTASVSGSSAERGNDWLCPCLRLPRGGPSCGIALPRAFENWNRLLRPLLEESLELEVLGDPIAPNSALGECKDRRSLSVA